MFACDVGEVMIFWELTELTELTDSLVTGSYGSTMVSINHVRAFDEGEALMYNKKFHLKIARDSMLLESVAASR